MKKINFSELEISKEVKLYLKISVIILLLLNLFCLLTRFSIFIFMAYGYILGGLIFAIFEYKSEYTRLKCFAEAESKIQEN